MKWGVQVRHVGGEVRKRRGGCGEKKGEKDYLCIQEHCAVVSTAPSTKRQRSWLMWEIVAFHVSGRRKQMGKKKKKRRESARLVILITRQNTYLTSWPQPSHMMGFGNEPITLTDADEVEPKPLALVWPLSCASHKENHSTVLLSNEK